MGASKAGHRPVGCYVGLKRYITIVLAVYIYRSRGSMRPSPFPKRALVSTWSSELCMCAMMRPNSSDPLHMAVMIALMRVTSGLVDPRGGFHSA